MKGPPTEGSVSIKRRALCLPGFFHFLTEQVRAVHLLCPRYWHSYEQESQGPRLPELKLQMTAKKDTGCYGVREGHGSGAWSKQG